MPDSSVVSVLIPVYNRRHTIEAAVASAIAQDYPDCEIVVCDNASSDGTWDVVERYARERSNVRVHRNAGNAGPIANWRECLGRSTGALVKFVFSDDWLAPTAVSRLVAALNANPAARGAYCAAQISPTYPPSGERIHYRLQEEKVLSLEEYLNMLLASSTLAPVSPGCALFRREDVERALSWEPSMVFGRAAHRRGFGPDLMMFLVAAAAGGGLVAVPEVLAFFRHHPTSITVSSTAAQKVHGYRSPLLDLPTLVPLSAHQAGHLEAVLRIMAFKQSLKHPRLLPVLVREMSRAGARSTNGRATYSRHSSIILDAIRLSLTHHVPQRRVHDLVDHWRLRLRWH